MSHVDQGVAPVEAKRLIARRTGHAGGEGDSRWHSAVIATDGVVGIPVAPPLAHDSGWKAGAADEDVGIGVADEQAIAIAPGHILDAADLGKPGGCA